MELAIALLILVAFGFLYYGWIRLRQEAEAKARQLIFRKSHREGEGAVGRSHRVTPRSASPRGRRSTFLKARSRSTGCLPPFSRCEATTRARSSSP